MKPCEAATQETVPHSTPESEFEPPVPAHGTISKPLAFREVESYTRIETPTNRGVPILRTDLPFERNPCLTFPHSASLCLTLPHSTPSTPFCSIDTK